ncbi:MAG: methyltransferase [Spirochaetales bacterium]|nr:methyltransferase [Spirochaetales bacterium]
MPAKRKTPAEAFREALVNKTVPFRFMGEDLRLALSHALFSSFDVDSGSKLLLKTVAQRIDLANVDVVLDLGCGIGVLGLSLKKKKQDIYLFAVDRDALAMDFTAANALANGMRVGEKEGLSINPALGLRHLPEREFDLVLSNLPAKAGPAALGSIIAGLSRYVTADGVIAIVVVDPLKALAGNALTDAGYVTLYREGTREHTVFHARKTRTIEPDVGLDPYLRGEMTARIGRKTVRLSTAFGLPEFDTLNYATRLLESVLGKNEPRGRVLVWNPGQGYLPLLVSCSFSELDRLTLAGRDLLSLEIAEHNCLASGVDEARLDLRHAPSLFALGREYDFTIIRPDADPGVPWHASFLSAVASALKPEGVCVTAAKSTFFGRIDFNAAKTRILKDTRARGFRGIAFRVAK